MIRWLKDLDDILRGETTWLSGLKDGFSRVPAAGLSIVNIFLGMIYGVCMGVFALINREQPQYHQVMASMIKGWGNVYVVIAQLMARLFR